MSLSSVILFGSRANGRPRKYSDVDLLIVSPQFSPDQFERTKGLYDYWKLDLPVGFICLTPAEFEARKNWVSSIQGIALRTGIRILP